MSYLGAVARGLGDAVPTDLASVARSGEYVRLMWRVQLNLLPWMGPILSKVRDQLASMRDDPTGPFVAVAGPEAVEEGATILGYGSGYITAGVKLSARAQGHSYATLFTPLRCINVVLSKVVAPAWQWFSCTVELERIWRIGHLYDAEGVAQTTAGEDRGPLAPIGTFLDQLKPVLYVGGAIVALAYLAPFLPRPPQR